MTELEKKAKTIIVGFDQSKQAMLALTMAYEHAYAVEDAEVHVIGVLDDKRSFAALRPSGKPTYETALEVQSTLKKDLAALVDVTNERVRLYVHVRIGHAAKEILALASECAADLIVVGTHGRSGVERLLLGSVAEKLVRHAPCPVLVSRPRQEIGAQLETELQPDPPCPQCVQTRLDSKGQAWWCVDHTGKHLSPHSYHYHRDNPNQSAFGRINPP